MSFCKNFIDVIKTACIEKAIISKTTRSKSTVRNKKPRYRPETVRRNFIKAKDVRETMLSILAQKENLKHSSFFVKEHQEKERTLNSSYEKVFTSLYWLCKDEIAISKAVSLFDLYEMLGVSDIE